MKNKSTNNKTDLAEEWPPEIVDKINNDRIARQKVQNNNPELFTAISYAMFKHDPIGINFDTNTDEYDSEAGTVIPRLQECKTSDDVATILHEEFVKWFDVETAGQQEQYIELAKEIWELWKQKA